MKKMLVNSRRIGSNVGSFKSPAVMRTFALLLLLLTPVLAHAGVDVKAMRLWAPPEYTRAVLDVSAAAEYRVFMLSNPDRLVLDLKGGRSAVKALPDARGLVSKVRVGTPEKDTLRVVFDLQEAVRPKTFLLNPADQFGHRLVLDLYPAVSADRTPRPAEVKSLQALTQGQRDVVIAVDAGHGGDDPGAIGPGGTYEKSVTLKVAKLLARKIDNEPGMKAVLVRDGDYFVPHRDRFEKARLERADLFVSIHADAFTSAAPAGSSVFILGERAASNEAASYLAERENRSDLVGGVPLKDKDQTLAAVLLDLSQGATLEASAMAADHVLASLKQFGKTHKRHVERANFFVLRSPDVPSMLIETAFISNPEEERRLNDPAHRNRLTDAILGGIRDYFHTAPPPGTWIAANARTTPRSHIVGSGETLSEIAQRHQVSLTALRQANGLASDRVQAGARLKIPGST